MVIPALQKGGYAYQCQVRFRRKPEGRPYIADLLVTDPVTGCKLVVSLKWQQVPGTAEQKIPYEVMRLLELLEDGVCDKAYLVLGGTGWTLKEFYRSEGLRKYMPAANRVRTVGLEEFIELANARRL